jgi:hypothetical protein
LLPPGVALLRRAYGPGLGFRLGVFERRERRFSATCDGFDVHCAVRIAAADDLGRERLVRYCTRPPCALARIEVLRDGRIAHVLKVPRGGQRVPGIQPTPRL